MAEALQRWRAANDRVSAMPRGHADWLQWERAHGLDRPAPRPDDAPAGEPLSLTAVDALALAQQPALRVLPGLNATEQLARDRRAAALRAQARAAWVEAVTARAQRRLTENMLEAAELGAELARRQQAVGHFSAEQRLRHEQTAWQARQALVAARASEWQALARLWQHVGGTEDPAALGRRLPGTLPPPPALPDDAELAARQHAHHPQWVSLRAQWEQTRAALTDDAWQALERAWQHDVDGATRQTAPMAPRAEWRKPAWPHAWEAALHAHAQWRSLQRQLDADRWQGLQTAHALHQHAQVLREQWLPQVQQLEEEALLRYNGMLLSPWDLLEAVRQRLAAQHTVLAAERDAWLAVLALDAVAWGLPWNGPRPEVAATDTPTAAKGH